MFSIRPNLVRQDVRGDLWMLEFMQKHDANNALLDRPKIGGSGLDDLDSLIENADLIARGKNAHYGKR